MYTTPRIHWLSLLFSCNIQYLHHVIHNSKCYYAYSSKDRHGITEILLKVALSTINQTIHQRRTFLYHSFCSQDNSQSSNLCCSINSHLWCNLWTWTWWCHHYGSLTPVIEIWCLQINFYLVFIIYI